MNVRELLIMLHAQPFRAFRLHMADGRHLDVMHPDFLARSPSGRAVVVYLPEDRFEIVDLLLVASIEILNGKTRSRRKRA